MNAQPMGSFGSGTSVQACFGQNFFGKGLAAINIRWQSPSFPLSVYVEPCVVSGVAHVGFDQVFQAAYVWEKYPGSLVSFSPVMTPHKEQADLIVVGSDTPIQGREFEVGHTRRLVNSEGVIQQAEIILMTQPEIDRQLSATKIQERVQTTLLHELGHALGLEHSTNPQDVMYYQGWQVRQPSTADFNQLRRLYRH